MVPLMDLIIAKLDAALSQDEPHLAVEILASLRRILETFPQFEVKHVTPACEKHHSDAVEQFLKRFTPPVEAESKDEPELKSNPVILRILDEVGALLSSSHIQIQLAAIRLGQAGFRCNDLILSDVIASMDKWWKTVMGLSRSDLLSTFATVMDLVIQFAYRTEDFATRRVVTDFIPMVQQVLETCYHGDHLVPLSKHRKVLTCVTSGLEVLLQRCDISIETQHKLSLYLLAFSRHEANRSVIDPVMSCMNPDLLAYFQEFRCV
jgi:hypothetical protein